MCVWGGGGGGRERDNYGFDAKNLNNVHVHYACIPI